MGKALAISFAKAGASQIAIGARSALEDVQQAVLAAAKSAGHKEPQVLALKLDICDEASVAAAATATDKAFGKLDVVVNNAGYLEEWKAIADSDPPTWWRSWDTNIRGVYLATRALLPLLVKGDTRMLVNVGSRGGHSIRPGASGYQGTKFALMRFTEFICNEEQGRGIVAFTGNFGPRHARS